MSTVKNRFAPDRITVAADPSLDMRFHDGGLPHVKGVKNFQAARACRKAGASTDGFGYTYNHAAMLCFWNEKFWIEYLSNPKTEHEPPSQTLLASSDDGRHFNKPVVVFPAIKVSVYPYSGPNRDLLLKDHPDGLTETNCHQRVSFYVTKDDRLLVSGFYGVSPTIHQAPNSGYGVMRVVREVYRDGSFSPVYVLHYNAVAGYDASVVDNFPFFETSPDDGFKAGCREYLANHRVIQEWWEEQRFDKALFTVPGGAALCTYTLPDGDMIGVYKTGFVICSGDGGKTWSDRVQSRTLITNTAKVWGQKTTDGRYVLVYNPTRNGAHRWPLACVTGDNGLDFQDMAALVPEISPCRYEGGLKNLGAQYMRGIGEWNPRPQDNRLHMVYSINKEDIWALDAPVPLVSEETEPVGREFASLAEGELPEAWNLYVPKWCPIDTVRKDGRMALRLSDRDPYDRARAERLVKASSHLKARFSLKPETLRPGTAAVIMFEDQRGREAVRFRFDADGWLRVKTGGAPREWLEYPKEWLTLDVAFDCEKGSAKAVLSLSDTGEELSSREFLFNQAPAVIERAVFTTKNTLPFNILEDCGKGGLLEDLPNDGPAGESAFFVEYFESSEE